MALLAALTGGAGFLTSAVLSWFGWTSLGTRYCVAVVVAYLAFLLLLRGWIRAHRDRWEPEYTEADAISDAWDVADLASEAGGGTVYEGGGGSFGGAGATSSFGNPKPPSVTDVDLGDELGLIAVVAAVIGVVALSSLWLVWSAPTLFAELLVDAALAGGLYRRLRRLDGASWLSTALRRTALPFSIVLVVLTLAGFWLNAKAPTATTMGQAIDQIRAGDER